MLFNSFEFAIFFIAVFFLYWFVFNKQFRVQNFFLLIVSYIFYGWWDWRFLGLLILSSCLDYFVAIQIHKSAILSRKKFFLFLAIAVNLTILGFFKYFNFFVDSFAVLLDTFGFQPNYYTLKVILPVGVSFYTFQSMSYYIDVYRGKLEPTTDAITFFSYVSFFPQLVAGPIERAVNMLPQFLKRRQFDYQQAVDGLRLMIWGFFKKMVIADNCAVFVNQTFSNYHDASGYELVLGVVFFAFQIYGDFSGYSDIARGTAKILGFELMINFKSPYLSRSISEFWQRWHISLSTWFRDYVYIPLGGSKEGKRKSIRNTIIVFLVSGLWHGANWTFVIWGALNAVFILPSLIWGKGAKESPALSVRDIPGIVLTFSLTCFAWIFFRSDNVSQAWHYITNVFTADYSISNFPSVKFYIPIVIVVLFLGDLLCRDKGIDSAIRVYNKPVYGYLFDVSLIGFIILFGSFNKQTFIYFQF
jgi:alginate O-acetyltransferase complex protein AlgI